MKLTRGLGALATLLTVACSSAETSPPLPTSCKRTDRSGTYRLTFTEQSGTCGPVDATLVSLNDDGGKATAGCTLHSDVWSENDCKNERTFTCVETVRDPTQWGGKGTVTIDSVSVTRQATANGSRITGTTSVRINASSGDTCNGTYGLEYVRQ